jgi:GNAT superfamily N-acetyltransferase
MTITIRRLDEKFPEPWFSKLQREVFSDVQHESAAFAEVVAAERAGAAGIEEPNIAYSPMVRFGAYIDALDGEAWDGDAAVGDAAQGNDRLGGWSCGWMERRNCFYMANSDVRREHRRAGIYAALLEAVVSHARELGAHIVRSQHSVPNNPERLRRCLLSGGPMSNPRSRAMRMQPRCATPWANDGARLDVGLLGFFF